MHDSRRPQSAKLRRIYIAKRASLRQASAGAENQRTRTRENNDAIRRVIASHIDRVDYTINT